MSSVSTEINEIYNVCVITNNMNIRTYIKRTDKYIRNIFDIVHYKNPGKLRNNDMSEITEILLLKNLLRLHLLHLGHFKKVSQHKNK